MPIAKVVRRFERIVPVRFARAPHPTDPTVETGSFDANAPEPDDRGFLPFATGGAIFPVGLDQAIAFAARPEVRLRLIRVDMENTGQLFLSTNPANIVDIVTPAANAALPAQEKMMIKIKARTAGTTIMRVHFGAANGPIIHQIQVLVSPMIDVHVAAHVPTINGAVFIDPANPPAVFPALSTRSDANIRALFKTANAILFPYGIRFDPIDIDRPAAPLNFANQGILDAQTNEFNTATALNRVANALNTHFVPRLSFGNPATANGFTGFGLSARRSPQTYGLFISDITASGQTIAHESCHVFNLVNDPTNEFLHIDTRRVPNNPSGVQFRDDIISRRRLMYSALGFAASAQRPYRDDVGYGTGIVGGMLTVKQLNNDKTDLEMQDARRNAAALP
jgi:hypothetical protein